MRTIVFVTGVLAIVEGMGLLARPEWYRPIVNFFRTGRWIYVPAVLKVILGIFFLVAATHCNKAIPVVILGILMSAGGVGMFLVKSGRIKAILRWWGQCRLIYYRLAGVGAILIGILIIYTAGVPH